MAYDGGLCLGRGARTRALLLDAIRAGQVVLEDVRAARLAGLRMVARERHDACLVSVCLPRPFYGRTGRVQQNVAVRGFVVRAILVEPRGVFMRARHRPITGRGA